jgi:hypothetical protein
MYLLGSKLSGGGLGNDDKKTNFVCEDVPTSDIEPIVNY